MVDELNCNKNKMIGGVSIIVISYNEEKYLRPCLDSCLAQGKEYIEEIIIGDDGSLDGSLEIIKEYQESYPDIIKFFVNDRNDGVCIPSIRVSNSIKKALDIAQGKYCVCISGDDIFLCEDYLSRAVDFFESDKKNKYSAVVANKFKYFWDNGEEKIVSVNELEPSLYWAGTYNHISCFVFRKDLVYNDLLDRFCDDTGLEYSLACCGKWKYLDACVFGYRQRAYSIMHSFDKLTLMLLELLLFQDCLNHKRFIPASFSRYFIPIKDVKSCIAELNDEKYQKYFDSAQCYKNNLLDMALQHKTRYSLFVLIGYFFSIYYKIVHKIRNMKG